MGFAARREAASRHERILFGLVLGLGALGTASLAQGVFDVALPAWRDEPPFAFTFALAERLGPGTLFVSILVHNLGLAGLVPGVGLLCMMLEPDARYRRWIPRILMGALLASMGSAFLYMLFGAGDFDLRFSLPLLLAEGTSVLGIATISLDELARLGARRPGPRDVAAAFEPLAFPLFVVALGLIALAILEVRFLLGA